MIIEGTRGFQFQPVLLSPTAHGVVLFEFESTEA
jgi:hypothetical protein